MNEDQRDAAVGRVVRERNDANRELSLLTTEARRIGHIFVDLGNKLQTTPEYVIFENQEANLKYSTRIPVLYRSNDIDGKALLKLTHDIRVTMDKLSGLNEDASKVGA